MKITYLTPQIELLETVSNTADRFYGINSGERSCAIYVPNGSMDTYKAEAGWSTQTNYIAIE